MLANLDEPPDPGVDIELCYASLFEKYIIGYRTDVRSPYGGLDDTAKGMHFFPAYQCDAFLYTHMPCETMEQAEKDLRKLAHNIDNLIQKEKDRLETEIPGSALENKRVQAVLSCADLLFSDINNFHSEKGLEEIAGRYANQRVLFQALEPEIYVF